MSDTLKNVIGFFFSLTSNTAGHNLETAPKIFKLKIGEKIENFQNIVQNDQNSKTLTEATYNF